MSRQRIFALIDVNNCYVSCERIFNPQLNDRPVIVLSNNDGCVISRSAEAKALGIKMAVPIYQIKHLIRQHQVAVLSSNYALYAEMSKRFMNVLARFVEPCDQEIYSIDECFLELSSYHNLYDLSSYAKHMLETVKTWLGLPCCIGIGYSKTQAKIANHLAKTIPSFAGVCNFVDEDPCIIEDILSQTAVGEVWGVGRKLSKRLNAMQVHSVMDLLESDEKHMGKYFSVALENTVRELNGISCIELIDEVPERQQIISSRSFGAPVHEQHQLSEALTEFTLRAVERLRAQKLLCRSVGISIYSNRFLPEEYIHPYTVVYLDDYSDDVLNINHAVQQGLKRIFKAGHRYKKAGIVLLDIIPQRQYAPDLFSDQSTVIRRAQLSETMEKINQGFGKDKIVLGRLVSQRPKQWAMQQKYKSPSYLTKWTDLLTVN